MLFEGCKGPNIGELHSDKSRLFECLPMYCNIQFLLNSVGYMGTDILQHNGAISVLGIMFVLDLSAQFLKCLTIMVCTDVTFCDFKSTSTVASMFVWSCVDRYAHYLKVAL